jgi:hypothetical protein
LIGLNSNILLDFLALDRSIFTGSKGWDIQFYKGLPQVPVVHAVCKLSARSLIWLPKDRNNKPWRSTITVCSMYQDAMYQAHCSVDYVDLHEFWCNSSDIPATPPPVECLLFPDPENLQAAFNWPAQDPLLPTTQFEDIIFYMSAFVPARLLHWVDIRLTELDQIMGQTIEEHLFHLPSTNYDKSDLYWVRRHILDIVSVPSNDRPRLFRLNLQPRTDLPTYLLDPAFPLYTTWPFGKIPGSRCLCAKLDR